MNRSQDEVRVTLVSNINHSVYAARALHRLGVLDRYLGPVIVDSEARWPGLISPRFASTRAYPEVDELPLHRLLFPDVATRALRSTPLHRRHAARLGSRVLDAAASGRLGRPDVLHLNTAGLVRTVAHAGRLGALVVADHREVHPRAHTGEDPLLCRLERELAVADWVLANSDRSALSLREWGVPEHKVVTIPLGADIELFTPDQAREPESHTNRQPRVLFVGAMIPAKGLDTLLAALGHPDLSGFTARLCGPKVDAELVGRCEAAPSVTVVGPLPRAQLREEYRAADVLVLPSLNDAFGLVVVEALACGTPVVVTSECGVASLVTPEIGRVVAPEEPGQLMQAIREAVELNRDPQTRSRARTVAASSSWFAYIDRLESWYREVVIPAALERRRQCA